MPTYRVTDKSGRVIVKGDTVTDFRGDQAIFEMVTRGTEYNGTAKVQVTWTCDPESDECEHYWHKDNTNRCEYNAQVYGLTVETVQDETDIHPEWVVQGRYGYYYVDETRPGDGCNAVYDTVDRYKSRKTAERVAKALNRAYRRGTGEK